MSFKGWVSSTNLEELFGSQNGGEALLKPAKENFTMEKTAEKFKKIISRRVMELAVGKDIPRLCKRFKISTSGFSSLSTLGSRMSSSIQPNGKKKEEPPKEEHKPVARSSSLGSIVTTLNPSNNSELLMTTTAVPEAEKIDKKKEVFNLLQELTAVLYDQIDTLDHNVYDEEVNINNVETLGLYIETSCPDAVKEILKACNQDALAPAAVMLKICAKEDLSLYYNDGGWRIFVEYCVNSVTVTHSRREEVMAFHEQENHKIYTFEWMFIIKYDMLHGKKVVLHSIDIQFSGITWFTNDDKVVPKGVSRHSAEESLKKLFANNFKKTFFTKQKQ